MDDIGGRPPVPARLAAPIDAAECRRLIESMLDACGARIVACSGGIDSLLLATVAHRHDPAATVVAHTVTHAVPAQDTARVLTRSREEGWNIEVVRSREFGDERYLRNPIDRCYHCKTHLYDAVGDLRASGRVAFDATILSGANIDDLAEYRPGLRAADEHGVRHPYVELGMGKAAIRRLARHLGMTDADLPASPCLASRLYTGTRVTEARLRAVEVGEAVLRAAGIAVVRCRISDDTVLVEVSSGDRARVTPHLLADVRLAMRAAEPGIADVSLDEREYRPGRAVLRRS